MPADALDGKVVCFFQSADKFKADRATLDEGAVWATYFALTEVRPRVEKRIAALVQQAMS